MFRRKSKLSNARSLSRFTLGTFYSLRFLIESDLTWNDCNLAETLLSNRQSRSLKRSFSITVVVSSSSDWSLMLHLIYFSESLSSQKVAKFEKRASASASYLIRLVSSHGSRSFDLLPLLITRTQSNYCTRRTSFFSFTTNHPSDSSPTFSLSRFDKGVFHATTEEW